MPSNTHVCLSYMLSWILTSGMIYDGHSQMTKRQQYCKSHRSHSDRQHDKSGSGLHSYLGWVCITRACWNDCDATACYGRAKVRKRVLVLHAVLGLHFQHDLRWQLTHDKKRQQCDKSHRSHSDRQHDKSGKWPSSLSGGADSFIS